MSDDRVPDPFEIREWRRPVEDASSQLATQRMQPLGWEQVLGGWPARDDTLSVEELGSFSDAWGLWLRLPVSDEGRAQFVQCWRQLSAEAQQALNALGPRRGTWALLPLLEPTRPAGPKGAAEAEWRRRLSVLRAPRELTPDLTAAKRAAAPLRALPVLLAGGAALGTVPNAIGVLAALALGWSATAQGQALLARAPRAAQARREQQEQEARSGGQGVGSERSEREMPSVWATPEGEWSGPHSPSREKGEAATESQAFAASETLWGAIGHAALWAREQAPSLREAAALSPVNAAAIEANQVDDEASRRAQRPNAHNAQGWLSQPEQLAVFEGLQQQPLSGREQEWLATQSWRVPRGLVQGVLRESQTPRNNREARLKALLNPREWRARPWAIASCALSVAAFAALSAVSMGGVALTLLPGGSLGENVLWGLRGVSVASVVFAAWVLAQ